MRYRGIIVFATTREKVALSYDASEHPDVSSSRWTYSDGVVALSIPDQDFDALFNVGVGAAY